MSRELKHEEIVSTASRLEQRVNDRFPGSGLLTISKELHQLAKESKKRLAWIQQPHYILRVGITFVILLLVVFSAILVFLFITLALRNVSSPFSIEEFVQTAEAEISALVILGAGLFFLVSSESRLKRKRCLAALRELRAIAHMIDMHQLTKDPEYFLKRGKPTGNSPKRRLSAFELSRYLDYCSEMLSLISKIAAYYERSEDPVILEAVNDIETFTNSLSRKIWQKIMLTYVFSEKQKKVMLTD